MSKTYKDGYNPDEDAASSNKRREWARIMRDINRKKKRKKMSPQWWINYNKLYND